MNFHMLRAIFCGGVMIGLAAASIVFESQVHVPLATEYGFMCLTEPARLLGYDNHRSYRQKAGFSVYELETDKLEMRSPRQYPLSKHSLLPDGLYVSLGSPGATQSLRVMNRETLETIREATLPVSFRAVLLNQRYLVTDRSGMMFQPSGTMFVCDVLADDPSQLRTLPLTGWHPLANTMLYVVEGTNLVVEVSASPPSTSPKPPNGAALTSNIHVYQIDEESIRLVASWKSGSSNLGVFRQGDTLLNLSPDSLTLEGRDLRTFELVRNEPLPKAIVDCLPSAEFKCDLCEVYDPRSQQGTIYRLDTLKELDNVRGLSYSDRGLLVLYQLDSPYRLLHSKPSLTQFRIAVYDMERDKLVWDRTYVGYPTAELLDGDRLAVAYSQYGITTEIIDLKTGRTLKKGRPYAWLLPEYMIWAVAAACAAFGWIFYSARAGLSLMTSILMLAAAVVPVQIYPLTQHGTAVNVGRLATSYSLAVLMSATAGVVWLAFSKLQNRTMRFTYQLAVLSVIAIALAALVQQDAFPQQWMLPSVLFIASASAFASFMGLMVLRFRGYQTRWPSSNQYAQSNPILMQLFALTAASAGMLVAIEPFRTIPWQFPKHPGLVAAFAVPVVIPYLFVFLLLKVSDRWFQRWTFIAAAVAALLVIDFTGAFVRPHLFTVNIVTANFRICLAGFVITFLWLWAFRLRGCSITRLGDVKPSIGENGGFETAFRPQGYSS